MAQLRLLDGASEALEIGLAVTLAGDALRDNTRPAVAVWDRQCEGNSARRTRGARRPARLHGEDCRSRPSNP